MLQIYGPLLKMLQYLNLNYFGRVHPPVKSPQALD